MLETASYEPREVRWSGPECKFEREGVTIVAGQGALPEGTIIGKFTSGDNAGKYGKYTPAATDGTETAYGILSQSLPVSTVDVRSTVYVAGKFRVSELGAEYDENARIALRGRLHDGDLSLIIQGGD